MAEKLLLYYKYIQEEMGFSGRTKLAIWTKIPSTLAATRPDSSEDIKKFKEVIEKITGKPAPNY
jgi:hypothetical protein